MSSTDARAPVRVRVPATSANLGPGFDALGLALTLYDEVTLTPLSRGHGVEIEVHGEGGSSVPRGEDHLVLRAFRRGAGALGLDLPDVRLECVNRIPHGRGLGSSAAAIVAGLALARAVARPEAPLDDDGRAWVLALGAELEGHPDNVAPAALGGLTVAYLTAGGAADAVRLAADPGLAFVVGVPDQAVPTSVARGLLPDRVPHRDAAFNAARAALLVAALTGHPDRLLAATEDRLHQPYRAEALGATPRVLEALRAQGRPAVVSGAGPTVLVPSPVGSTADVAAEVAALVPEAWSVLRLAQDLDGVRVLP